MWLILWEAFHYQNFVRIEMNQPADQFAARYGLQLNPAWQAWFNEDCRSVPLPASFTAPLPVGDLLDEAPSQIWPGFMLPDTLPLVSNLYGDWICVRVEAQDGLGELLHWYHGGGDWIPVGQHLSEMVVHDVVDQFRPLARQMLRGAPESMQPARAGELMAQFHQPRLQQWLVEYLPRRPAEDSQSGLLPTVAAEFESQTGTAGRLQRLAELLEQSAYDAVLAALWRWRWAEDAVACDLIQHALQPTPPRLADAEIARQAGIDWSPDYVRWLFDLDQVPQELRGRLLELAGEDPSAWPQQDWPLAGHIASQVLQRRNNLGWAVNVAGWSSQRQGQVEQAAEIYFSGRFASAFSDQGVRMRSHWNQPQRGKFTVAQLLGLDEYLTDQQRGDGYLSAIRRSPPPQTRAAVQQWWLEKAAAQLDQAAPAEAYESFYRAGWDMGVQRLGDYLPILEGMVVAAEAAGWPARAAVAQTHLNCLRARL